MENNQLDHAGGEETGTRSGIPVWIWVLAGILIGGLFATAGFLIFTSDGPSASGVAKRASEVVFEHPGQGFSLTYPKGWKRLNKGELANYEGAFSFGIKHEKPSALIGVRVQKLDAEGAELKEVSRALDRTMPDRFDDFTKIGEEMLTLSSGGDALIYDYTFLADRETRIREQLLIVPTVEKVYYVTAWAEAKSFTRVLKDVDRITRSFSTE